MKVHWLNLLLGVAAMLLGALILWLLRAAVRVVIALAIGLALWWYARQRDDSDDLGDTTDEGVGAS